MKPLRESLPARIWTEMLVNKTPPQEKLILIIIIIDICTLLHMEWMVKGDLL